MSSQGGRRISFNDLPEIVPIFPLSGALLLPRARLPLNIFEPRYLAMIDDALRSDQRLIGMIQPRQSPDKEEPQPASPSAGALYPLGCVGRIVSFSETDDGRYLIALHGLLRFRLEDEVSGFQPYRRARVNWTAFESDLAQPSDALDDEDRDSFLDLLRKYFEVSNLSADWDALKTADTETLINAIAMLCPFEPQEKQALLEAPNLDDRLSDLKALMQFAVASPIGPGDLQ